MDGTPLRKFVPGNVAANMAADNPACPLNGRDVFRALSPLNVITGTPLPLIGRFADSGIRKGNVGTQWQNVAHAGLPPDLMRRMREWAKEAGKDIKFATKKFQQEIDAVPAEYARGIEDAAYREALALLRAFRAEGTARIVSDTLAARV